MPEAKPSAALVVPQPAPFWSADCAGPAPAMPDDLPPQRTQRLFGLSVAEVDADQAVARILHWSGRSPSRTVLMASLDEVRRIRREPMLRRAYGEADLIIEDSAAFRALARYEGSPLNETVGVAALLASLMAGAESAGRRVFLVGRSLERIHGTARRLKALHRRLNIAGAYAPPPGFERDPASQDELTRLMRVARPDIILVSLGSPQQEIWSTGMADSVRHGVFVVAGDPLDDLLAPKRGGAGVAGLPRAVFGLVLSAARKADILVALPGLLRRHGEDRQKHEARLRRRLMGLQTERYYREVRAATRLAERDRALLGEFEEP